MSQRKVCVQTLVMSLMGLFVVVEISLTLSLFLHVKIGKTVILFFAFFLRIKQDMQNA